MKQYYPYSWKWTIIIIIIIYLTVTLKKQNIYIQKLNYSVINFQIPSYVYCFLISVDSWNRVLLHIPPCISRC